MDSQRRRPRGMSGVGKPALCTECGAQITGSWALRATRMNGRYAGPLLLMTKGSMDARRRAWRARCPGSQPCSAVVGWQHGTLRLTAAVKEHPLIIRVS